jgi:adenylylsulfate kinase-like enzyme
MSQHSSSAGPIVWFTGLPASGKTTLALAVKASLRDAGRAVVHLDSDDLRPFFPGYDADSRDRFYAALAHLAALGAAGGAVVLVSATANLRRYRDAARAKAPGAFVEVFVDAPLDLVSARDPKGLYTAARADAETTLPGIGAPFEPPIRPDLTVDASRAVALSRDDVLQLLARGRLTR